MKKYIRLGDVISKASVERCGNREYPVLSITMKDGLVFQDEKFKKRIASVDTAEYKVIPRGKLVQGIHIDEANFGIQDITDTGIVSPAYKVWDVRSDIIYPKYLEIIMRSPRSIAFYKSKLNGSVNRRGRMTDNDFLGMTIPFDKYDRQKEIVSIIGKVKLLLGQREQELQKLDELIKARFVELFGDPLAGSEKWPIHTVGDVAEAIDPQPSHRTPPIDESGIPYVSTKDCDYKTGVIDFEHARKVGRNVLEEHLQRYELHAGDFIIGKIGTIGNPIFVPARKDYTLSANIVLIQPDKKKVSPYFLKYSFMSAFMDKQFEEAKNSTSQAAFGIQKVRMIKVMDPAMEVQLQFETLAKQVDKSKVAVQNALDEAQVLFDSLMQQYFG